MKNNYEVGYAKPPKDTQFRPGESGNSKGRTKGSKNTLTILREIANQKIQVQEGGENIKMTRRMAMLKQLFNQSMKGNIKAIGVLMPYLIDTDLKEDEKNMVIASIKADDKAIIERALKNGVKKCKK